MSGGGATAPGVDVAPFMAKTYRMVDDPSTDAVIAWGPGNNGFVVADLFALARALLPAYHCNFSSFVRQLNTYGFRKVDPDRWEFAHVSFLRGQTRLLHRVVRQRRGGKRKHHTGGGSSRSVVEEVARLRREHKANEELLAAMSRRVQEIERQPKRMLAFFLAKAAGDPQVLRHVLSGTTGGGGRDGAGGSRNSAETEDSGPFKSARLLPDSDRGQLGSGDGDEAAGRRTNGVQGCGDDDFDFTELLSGGGSEGGTLMPPCSAPSLRTAANGACDAPPGPDRPPESSGGGKRKDGGDGAVGDEDDAVVAMEVVRLRREQRAIEEQVAAMWRRVQETERRPKQMFAFLIKVAGDPQVLRRLVSGGAGSDGAGFAAAAAEADDGASIKRARLLLDAGGSGSSDGAVDFSGFYSAGDEDDLGFGSDYLQPPPYVFPVNSGY